MVLPGGLIHTQDESFTLADSFHPRFMVCVLFSLLLEEAVVLIRDPLVVLEETASYKRFDLRIGWLPRQVSVLLLSEELGDLVGSDTRGQVS